MVIILLKIILFLNHNHRPDPCQLSVKKNIKYIVSKGLFSRDKPSQIIQEATSRIPVNFQPYMPSVEATRKIISRCRRHQKPPEPTSLSQIDIPLNLCKSFNLTKRMFFSFRPKYLAKNPV